MGRVGKNRDNWFNFPFSKNVRKLKLHFIVGARSIKLATFVENFCYLLSSDTATHDIQKNFHYVQPSIFYKITCFLKKSLGPVNQARAR